jgi:hypothetical protein
MKVVVTGAAAFIGSRLARGFELGFACYESIHATIRGRLDCPGD